MGSIGRDGDGMRYGRDSSSTEAHTTTGRADVETVTVEFVYRALDEDGELKRGTLVAPTATAAADRLRRLGLRPVSVGRRRLAMVHRELHLPGSGRKRGDALAIFARQFAAMVGSGTPLLRSLTILARQTEDSSLREAILEVRADIENGEPLSVAMSHRPDWFGTFVVSMVEAGESAGAALLGARATGRIDRACRGVAPEGSRSARVSGRHRLHDRPDRDRHARVPRSDVHRDLRGSRGACRCQPGS